MHSRIKTEGFRLQLPVFLLLICCAPVTLKADILDSAVALGPSDILLAAGGLLTVLGLLRPFKRKQQQEEE